MRLTSDWNKSSYSGARGDCLETRVVGESAQLRDTQNRDQGPLTFPHHEWAAFITELHSL